MSEGQAESQTKSRLEGLFGYTQHSFWGGAWYPYWSLILVTIFGGFFGLDHLYLRSPSTAVLKFVLNIVGLGLWYFYDLIQILAEKDTVMKYGLSVPGIGPLGIGAGMFKDNHPGEPPSKSPFRYLAYMCLVWLPFGFEYLVAGDSNGALAKFISMFLLPIGIIWTILNVFNAYFNTKSLFTKGSYRMFPFNWFMDPYGLSKLGPIDQPQPRPPDRCDPGGAKGVFRTILDRFVTALTWAIGSAMNIILPGVRPAVGAAATLAQTTAEVGTAAVGAAGKVLTSSASLASQVIDAAAHPAAVTTAVASELAGKIPGATAAAAALPSAVSSQVAPLVTPEGIQAAAKAPLAAVQAVKGLNANPLVPLVPPASITEPLATMAKNQVGGSLAVLDAFDGSSTALFLLFIVLLGGGTYYALRRLNNSGILPSNKKEDDRQQRKGSERNDAPPQS